MSRQIIRTPDAPGLAADGSSVYSQAVKAAGLVFVAGQGPFDATTGAIVGETIQEQTSRRSRNYNAILRAAGKALSKVVGATLILRDAADFSGMNEEWKR